MYEEFEEKVVVVTGSASGIGLATATALADAGSIVYCVDLSKETGEAATREIAVSGGKVFFHQLDVTDQDGWAVLVDAIRSEQGRLDILINCAGICEVGPIENTPFEAVQRSFEINFGGPYKSLRAVAPLMKERSETAPWAVIVNVSSAASSNGVPFFTGYAASKAAVESLTKTAALEFVRLGYHIRVNSVHPGTIDTEMVRNNMKVLAPQMKEEEYQKMGADGHPVGRMGKAEDVMNAILYLANDRASFSTGITLSVDGGRGAGEWSGQARGQ